MKAYDRHILNALLDSYERSALFSGTNKVNRKVRFSFTRKNLPEYFDESSTAYEEIHASLRQMEAAGYIEIIWKKGKEGHIVQSVALNLKALPRIYSYLGRASKQQLLEEMIRLLKNLRQQYPTPVALRFVDFLLERLQAGKTVKEYISLSLPEEAERLVRAVSLMESNRKDCYLREFSIAHFSDSKAVEEMRPGIARIFRQFEPRFADSSAQDIFAEYSIYHTPNFVYFKGACALRPGRGSFVDLREMKEGIGLCGSALAHMKLEHTENIRKLITIENLTSFFRWQEQDCILIYLGGYLNEARRTLLKEIYRQIPDAACLHFGDIDIGGFEIYEDLRRRTGIPFRPYYMDLATLREHERFARPLTENDRGRLSRLREKHKEAPYLEVLDYMEDKGIKLEQECVEPRS